MPLGDPASGKPGTVLITGTTSGVGLNALKSLIDRGWTVVTANRDPVRAAAAADSLGIDSARVHHLRIDLGDLESVRVGVETLVASLGLSLDALVINAAVYKPRLKQPEWSPQGYEISMATNHLGHFLLIQLLLKLFLEVLGGPSDKVSLQIDDGLVRNLVVLDELGDLGLLFLNFDIKAELILCCARVISAFFC